MQRRYRCCLRHTAKKYNHRFLETAQGKSERLPTTFFVAKLSRVFIRTARCPGSVKTCDGIRSPCSHIPPPQRSHAFSAVVNTQGMIVLPRDVVQTSDAAVGKDGYRKSLFDTPDRVPVAGCYGPTLLLLGSSVHRDNPVTQ